MRSLAWISAVLVACIGCANAAMVRRGFRPPPPPPSPLPKVYECARVEILFIGLPAYHPWVISQGFDPAVVDAGLKAQLLALTGAGYNTKELFFAPELGVAPLVASLQEKRWDAVIVGFGSRGDATLEGTIHFEETVNAIREKAPTTKILFNRSPVTNIEAVQRNFGLSGCENKPGRNYGEHILCSPSICTTAPPGWGSS